MSTAEARHQVRTRAFNEWIEGANDSMGRHAGTDPVRCECGDAACVHGIALTRAEYERVRSHPNPSGQPLAFAPLVPRPSCDAA